MFRLKKDDHEDLGSPLCTTCLTPVEEGRHFCSKCGAPATTVAELDPLRLIQSQGFVFRRGAARPTFIVLVGMWIIFVPMALACFLVMFHSKSWNAILFATSLITVYVFILAKVTRNYFALRMRSESEPQPTLTDLDQNDPIPETDESQDFSGK